MTTVTASSSHRLRPGYGLKIPGRPSDIVSRLGDELKESLVHSRTPSEETTTAIPSRHWL